MRCPIIFWLDVDPLVVQAATVYGALRGLEVHSISHSLFYWFMRKQSFTTKYFSKVSSAQIHDCHHSFTFSLPLTSLMLFNFIWFTLACYLWPFCFRPIVQDSQLSFIAFLSLIFLMSLPRISLFKQ